MFLFRRKKGKKSKAVSKEQKKSRHEVIGILLVSFGIFLGLALFSYSPLDPSFNSFGSHSVVQNLIGLVGSYLSDGLINLFGFSSYLLVFILILGGFFSFRETTLFINLSRLGLLGSFILFSSIFLHLTFNDSARTFPAGGVIGMIFADPLRHYLNPVGAYLAVLSFALLTFVWGTGFSLAQTFFFFRKWLYFFQLKGKSIATVYGARLKKQLERYRQKKAEQQKELAHTPKIQKPIIFTEKEEKSRISQIPEKMQKILPKESEPNEPFSEPVAEPKVFKRNDLPSEEKADQLSFVQMMKGFVLPPINLLDPTEKKKIQIDEASLKMSSKILEKKLQDFGVEGRITEIHPGPVITMYEFEPAPGIKVSKIVGLEDDLSLNMGGRSVRIVSHLEGKAAVGIEVPNHTREIVSFRAVVSDLKFQKAESKLTLAMGEDIEGVPFISDLQKMPHLLVAGATGTGKSVCLNSMILSILYRATPEEVRFIFVDPKMLELSIYQGIPHLLLPVVTEPKKAANALRWAVAEMERRYRLMAHAQIRNIAGYNKKIEGGMENSEVPTPPGYPILKHEGKLPYIVILIDELADLMMVAGREVEEQITRLAQMARAAGIHLILATQRPSVDVITGIIKANFPARVSFKVSSTHDSRTIIDGRGAESLLGAGDMLFIPPGASKLVRLHGAYVSDAEVARVVEHLKKQAKPVYDESILEFKDPKEDEAEIEEMSDELYDQAIAIVTESRQASISMVQRRLRIGYNRAARMIERMEAEGIVSAPSGSKGREVLARSLAD